jgi:hypothetical protein
MEHSDLNKLLTNGLTGKSRVLALERTIAQIGAQKATAEFAIAKANSDIKALTEEKEQIFAALCRRGESQFRDRSARHEYNRRCRSAAQGSACPLGDPLAG